MIDTIIWTVTNATASFTTAASADAANGRVVWISSFYDLSDAMIDAIGEPATYCLLTYGVLKFQLFILVRSERETLFVCQEKRSPSLDSCPSAWYSLFSFLLLLRCVVLAVHDLPVHRKAPPPRTLQNPTGHLLASIQKRRHVEQSVWLGKHSGPVYWGYSDDIGRLLDTKVPELEQL